MIFEQAANFYVARGDVMDLDLDLHVNPFKNVSTGEILLDGGKGVQGNTDYCFIYMKQENELITFTDISEPHGGKPKAGCTAYRGQTFSTLYLYNFKKLTPTSTGYQSAKVNGDTYLMDLIELDSSEFVGTFKLVKNATFGGKIKIADIKTIELSIEVPPAPAEQ